MARKLKRILRDVLWRFFVRLDDSFASNAANPISQPVTQPSTTTQAEAPLQPTERKTLVVNDRWIISSAESLATLFNAIFPAAPPSPLLDELINHCASHPELWIDSDRITAELRRLLLRSVSESTPGSANALSLLSQLDSHIDETNKARAAYLPTPSRPASAIFWPDPTSTKEARSLFDAMPELPTTPIVSKTTPVGSAGSCFAAEIAWRLQEDGFNYIVTEPVAKRADGLSNASANWGTIFNTPSFSQLIARAYGVVETPRILWSRSNATGSTQYLDPFREDVKFDSVAEYEAGYAAHLDAARQALSKAEVFIITLGVNEVWRYKADGTVFSLAPWRVAPDLVSRHVLTVDENVAYLQQMLDTWRRFNPAVKLIVSVSPVPLHATFLHDTNAIVANAHSKAVLRVAAERFVSQNVGVYYMPSYEVVMYGVEKAWQADQRHVSREAVDKVMALFQRIFVQSDPPNERLNVKT